MAADGRIRRVGLVLLVLLPAVTGHGFAQTDLAAQWRALPHEDIGHRLEEAAAAPGMSGAGGPWVAIAPRRIAGRGTRGGPGTRIQSSSGGSGNHLRSVICDLRFVIFGL